VASAIAQPRELGVDEIERVAQLQHETGVDDVLARPPQCT
jgi:hypothetical protein